MTISSSFNKCFIVQQEFEKHNEQRKLGYLAQKLGRGGQPELRKYI